MWRDTSVTGNLFPLVFDLDGINPLADSIPGFECFSCLDLPQITWTSIFHPLVAKLILKQYVGHVEVCELCSAMENGDGDWPRSCIHVLKICKVDLC